MIVVEFLESRKDEFCVFEILCILEEGEDFILMDFNVLILV